MYYDCSRGQAGQADGLPNGLEGRGKAFFVRQGAAHVPSLKVSPRTCVVLRVPFTKNGGGDHLNQLSVTFQLKMTEELLAQLYSTAGWDSWSKAHEGDDPAQLLIQPTSDVEGVLGVHGCFGDGGSPRVRLNEWHCITATVDLTTGVMCTYLDGRLAATVKAQQLCRDGQHAIKRRLALFWSADGSDAVTYLRSVSVHNCGLSSEQVRKEHAMLQQLLIEDAIAATPGFMHDALTGAHADAPFANTNAVRRRLSELVRGGLDVGAQLWHALQLHDEAGVHASVSELEPHQAELCARWRLRDGEGALAGKDETSAPFGETLAHAAAHAGSLQLLQLLLGTGAQQDLVRRRGVLSGFTVLHSAVLS